MMARYETIIIHESQDSISAFMDKDEQPSPSFNYNTAEAQYREFRVPEPRWSELKIEIGPFPASLNEKEVEQYLEWACGRALVLQLQRQAWIASVFRLIVEIINNRLWEVFQIEQRKIIEERNR